MRIDSPVTRSRERLEQVKSRRQRVELADRLRAPLTVVQGYVSMLAAEGLPARERTRAFAMAIEKCGEINWVIHQLLADHDFVPPWLPYVPGSAPAPVSLRLLKSHFPPAKPPGA